MIQRIQTLFLALTALLLGTLFFKGWGFVRLKGEMTATANPLLTDDSLYNIYDSGYTTLGLTASAIILTLITIFLFQNRNTQILFSWLVFALVFILVVYSLIVWYQSLNTSTTSDPVAVGLAVIPVLLVMICIPLAIKYIGKDEKLVKSMDRLR